MAVTVQATSEGASPHGFVASDAYRFYVLALLISVGVCSWVDRIFSILLQPIKLEFGFSDTQLGLLGGIAFGLFYAAVGLPVAWLADRYNRRNIITIALALWSAMTALGGLASGFGTMFLARVGVGLGEAGGSPPSQSLVADYFPPERRAFAMGVLFMYIPLGFLLGFLVGGWVNQFFGWRTALMVVGLPGLALSMVVRFTLREPPRGMSEQGRQATVPPPSLSAQNARFPLLAALLLVVPDLVATVRYFLSRSSLRHLPLAGAIHGVGAWGAAVWMPSYFMRQHGMASGELGTWMALIFGVFGTLGALSGGRIADALVARTGDARWYPWFSALVIVAGVPFGAMVYLWPDPRQALLFLIVPTFLGHMFLGPVTGTIQSLAGVRRRAVAAAFYLFLANLISMGGGPLIIGAISDLFSARFGADALRWSILTLLVVTGLWAGLHFVLAARTLREDLAMADQD